MKSFESFSPPEKKQEITLEDLLSQEDKELLKKGLETLKKHLEALETKELPTTFVFLDSSARPLKDLVRPLITKIYTERGIEKPLVQYLNINGRNTGHNYARQMLYAPPESARRHLEWFINHYQERLEEESEKDSSKDFLQREIEKAQKRLSTFDEDMDTTRSAFMFTQERLKEIIGSPADNQSDKKRILFIDDYVAAGETYDYLSGALEIVEQDQKSSIDWQFFTFFEKDYHPSLEESPENAPKKIVGVNDYDFPQAKDYEGLKYRGRQKTAELQAIIKPSVTGIEQKNPPSKYSKKSKIVNAKAKLLLKEALRKIGESVASK